MATFEAIASQTISSATASVTFSSVPSSYEHLQLRAHFKKTKTVGLATLRLRFNSDTGSNYTAQILRGNGSTATALALDLNGTSMSSGIGTSVSSAFTNIFGGAIIDILDYANSNKYTTTRTISGYDCNGASTTFIQFMGGLWLSTAAIDSVTILPDDTDWAVGCVFSLYGLRSA